MALHSAKPPKNEASGVKLNIKAPEIDKEKINKLLKNQNLITAGYIVAVLLLGVTLLVKLPVVLTYILLIIACVAAGFDICVAAVENVSKGKYYDINLILMVAVVLSFVIGRPAEAVAMLIAYQAGKIAVEYINSAIIKKSVDRLASIDGEIADMAKQAIANGDIDFNEYVGSVNKSADRILKLSAILGIVVSAMFCILSNVSVVDGIHRALLVLVVATPGAVTASVAAAAANGEYHAASLGIVYKTGEAVRNAAVSRNAVIDKSGILTDDDTRVVDIDPVISRDMFMTFAAHAVYYAELPLLKAITDMYKGDYKAEVIEDFNEIPGQGVELSIGGAKVVLGVKELFAGSGIDFKSSVVGRKHLYMTISGRYVGSISVSNGIKSDADVLLGELSESGISRFVLLTEDSNGNDYELSDAVEFSKVYSGLNVEGKINVVKEIANGDPNSVFIYSTGIEGHSAAALDIRVSRKGKYADAIVFPEYSVNLPGVFDIAKRFTQIIDENIMFSFLVKGILIFLGLTGNCTLWLALIIDSLATILAIAHTTGIDRESIFKAIIEKFSKK